MLRNFLDSSANILSYLMSGVTFIPASVLKEATAATIETTDAKIKDLVCNKEEYEVLVEPKEDKSSTSVDPVIRQLNELFEKNQFNRLVKLAGEAIQREPSPLNVESYLKNLDRIEDIINKAKQSYSSTQTREELENLHDIIISKRTDLSTGDTPAARFFRR